MSDKKEENQASVPPKMVILNQFIKDLSFENIAAQNGLKSENLTPDIKVNVTLEAKKRPIKNQYDVIIKTTISSEFFSLRLNSSCKLKYSSNQGWFLLVTLIVLIILTRF